MKSANLLFFLNVSAYMLITGYVVFVLDPMRQVPCEACVVLATLLYPSGVLENVYLPLVPIGLGIIGMAIGFKQKTRLGCYGNMCVVGCLTSSYMAAVLWPN